MRWYNAAGNVLSLQMKVAGQYQTIIALDALDIEALYVTGLNIHIGERIDAVLCADQSRRTT